MKKVDELRKKAVDSGRGVASRVGDLRGKRGKRKSGKTFEIIELSQRLVRVINDIAGN